MAFTEFDDRVEGTAGDDWLQGGAGADTIIGGDGSDWVVYVGSNIGVGVDLGSVGQPQTGGHAEGDQLDSIENVYGSTYGDNLTGSAFANKIVGEGGDDVIDGAGGDDLVRGGAGGDNIDGGAGDDMVYGGMGDDIVSGGAGDDLVGGGKGNDMVSGGAGDDTLVGGLGDDTLDGGDGMDVASFSKSVAAIEVDFNGDPTAMEAADRIVIDGGDIGDDMWAEIAGAGANDHVTTIEGVIGGMGNDMLTAHDMAATVLRGNQGNDTLTGGEGDDVLGGGKDDDLIEAGDGSDMITGGMGNDSITADDNADDDSDMNAIVDGDDTIEGGAGNDTIDGGGGDDTIDGGDGDDEITGVGGADDIMGGAGNDTIDGGGGLNMLAGGDGDDSLTAGGGNDTVTGGMGNDTIDAGDGENMLDGGGGDDKLTGGTGNDSLVGGDGDDSLAGGAGDDTFVGGAGTDTINGGGGTDIVFFEDLGAGIDYMFGQPIEGADMISGIEGIGGTDHDDTFTGGTLTQDAMSFMGGAGDDTFTAQGAYAVDDNNPDGTSQKGKAGGVKIDGGAGMDTFHIAPDGPAPGSGGTRGGGFVAEGEQTSDFIAEVLKIAHNIGGLRYNSDGNAFTNSDDDSIFDDYSDDDDGTGPRVDEHGGDSFMYSGGGQLVEVLNIEVFHGGEGEDVIIGDDQADEMHGSRRGDMLYGRGGDDTLYGDEDNDDLFGGDGVDMLYGGTGEDYLDGGYGEDHMWGSFGADDFNPHQDPYAAGGADGWTHTDDKSMTLVDVIWDWDSSDNLSLGSVLDTFKFGNSNDDDRRDELFDIDGDRDAIFQEIDVDVDGDGTNDATRRGFATFLPSDDLPGTNGESGMLFTFEARSMTGAITDVDTYQISFPGATVDDFDSENVGL